MLDKKQLKYLRRLAQGRKTIIRVGQKGLTENVLEEIENALNHHELVKLSIRTGERSEREEIISGICRLSNAQSVQKIGNTVSIYRRNSEKPVIRLP